MGPMRRPALVALAAALLLLPCDAALVDLAPSPLRGLRESSRAKVLSSVPAPSGGGRRSPPAAFLNSAVVAAEAGEHLFESTKDFLIGAVSGGIASFSVFPIDMAKTRLQDQKIVEGAAVVYKNAVQTIGRVFKDEGILACYSGVLPVVIGSAPEAALQLGGNNAGRNYFAEKLQCDPHHLPLWAEVVAGSLGGVMQVFATQPMERVKVLQQVLGAEAGSTLSIVKQLGVPGLYQGWTACALRDIPFSAIYFTSYARAKKALLEMRAKREGKKGLAEENLVDSMLAGLVAGVPGAGLTVPLDVIKTRMQSCGVGGKVCEISSLGIRETAKALYAEGGFRAFWKGAGPRVGRVGPQLAICLCIFEALKKMFPDQRLVKKAAKGKGGKGKDKK